MEEKKSNKILAAPFTDKLYWLIRIAILASIVMLFIPSGSATRISETLIGKGVSVFTTAVSWDTLTNLCAQAVNFAHLTYDAFYILRAGAIVTILGVIILAVGVCMTLGNNRFKKIANLVNAAGALVQIVGMILVIAAQSSLADEIASNPQLVSSETTTLPTTVIIFIVLAAVVLVGSLLNQYMLPKVDKSEPFKMETQFKLFLVLVPFAAFLFLFSYMPLFGWRYAFFNYEAGAALDKAHFAGWKWFGIIFRDSKRLENVMKVMRNTLIMSGLGIATSWLPMAFAILINEVQSKWFKKVVQVFTTIPNFVSWVLVYTLAYAMFSSDGIFNSLFGITEKSFFHLANASGIWFKMLAWGTWKGLGWSAIIYIAGIAGIDPQLYEAATVDGAGRAQKMWHITVPGLIPTFCVLLLMNVANVLSNGMDQYLVFENDANHWTITVLDLYVYTMTSDTSLIPLSTVISMFKSIVSIILLFSANAISKAIRGESIM